MADGFKITMGILVGVLFLWVLVNTLQMSSMQSNLNSYGNTMSNSYASKYDVTSISDRVKAVETKLIYEVPQKYVVDSHGTYLDSLSTQLNALTTRVGRCACSW